MRQWKCSRCGELHDDLPFAYSMDAPAYDMGIPPEQWDERVELTDEVCMVDGQHFFLRGIIRLPVRASEASGKSVPGHFDWIVWASLSADSMRRVARLWDTPGREKEPPCFGWLCSTIPCYPSTLHLKTMVHIQPVGLRPLIELESTDHPLAIEQREGISIERVAQIAERALHPE